MEGKSNQVKQLAFAFPRTRKAKLSTQGKRDVRKLVRACLADIRLAQRLDRVEALPAKLNLFRRVWAILDASRSR